MSLGAYSQHQMTTYANCGVSSKKAGGKVTWIFWLYLHEIFNPSLLTSAKTYNIESIIYAYVVPYIYKYINKSYYINTYLFIFLFYFLYPPIFILFFISYIIHAYSYSLSSKPTIE